MQAIKFNEIVYHIRGRRIYLFVAYSVSILRLIFRLIFDVGFYKQRVMLFPYVRIIPCSFALAAVQTPLSRRANTGPFYGTRIRCRT